MKKTCVICLCLAMLLAFIVVPASAANYEAEDYTIPTDKIYPGYPNGVSVEQTTFQGKDVIALRKGTGEGNDWPILVIGEDQTKTGDEMLSNSLNVRVGDYKYLVVKCYWDLDKCALSTSHNIPFQIKANDRGTPWTYFKAQTNALGDKLQQFAPVKGFWSYLIFDLTKDNSGTEYWTDSAKYPNGADEHIRSMQFYFFTNGGFKNENLSDKDVCYVQFFTFTNNYDGLIKADKLKDQASQTTTTEPPTSAPETPTTPPEPPTSASEPSTGASTSEQVTNAPKEDDAGCSSTVGFAPLMVLGCGLAAGIVAKRKKKKDN